jgi:hypothetical protein
MIRLAKCERAIRRLYHAGESSLPLHERHPFRDPMETILSKSVCSQERWVSMTEDYLPAARRRVKEQTQKSQHSIKELFGRRNTLCEFLSEMVGILPFTSYFTFHQDRGWSMLETSSSFLPLLFQSRRRLTPMQAIGVYPTKYGLPCSGGWRCRGGSF